MATKKKMLMSAAGQAGGAGLDIDEVFSTYLFTGTGSGETITIDTGIDLAGEGGLVWIKSRTGTSGESHFLVDTERGGSSVLRSNSTGAPANYIGGPNFLSNGFSGSSNINDAQDYASWTFRKAPKFFDVVTYTGNGVSGRTISHDLGTTVGTLIVKCTSETRSWFVWHRGLSNGGNGWIALNDSAAEGSSSSLWDSTVPSDSVFTLGSSINTNGNGKEYVAYLFAHNDGDGDFGPDGDADVIKCGSFVGSSSTEVDLGFEPQWLLVKASSLSQDWRIMDNMRGISDGEWVRLAPNSSSAEASFSGDYLKLTPTGFVASQFNTGQTFIYMAIRRGPLAVPEDATEVFAPVFHNDDSSEINVSGGFTADAFISKRRSGTDTYMTPRLLGGNTLRPSSTGTELDYSANVGWDTQEGVNFTGWWGAVTDGIDWQWKRAPGFFDVVAYTGNGTARTVSHNLGVAPEMIWVKSRTSSTASYQWWVYHKDLGNTKYLNLNQSYAENPNTYLWNSTTPTESVFTLGATAGVNWYSNDYIAYLFASAPGVSKVGSYTGTGAALNIDCGFTSGARFVLLKRTDSANGWQLFDTERGIVAGNDPILVLNTSAPEEAFDDLVDPYSAGFSLTSSGMVNVSGGSYIFYAIA